MKAPPKLSREARRLWEHITSEYDIGDTVGRLLLQTALESFDRVRQAQKILARDGLVVKDRFGQPRQHPASLAERDAKLQMLRALHALNLEILPQLNGKGRAAMRQQRRRTRLDETGLDVLRCGLDMFKDFRGPGGEAALRNLWRIYGNELLA